MALYPIIDEPERQTDDTWIIRVHAAPGQTREWPAKDRKSANEMRRFLMAAATALVPAPEPPATRQAGRPIKLTDAIIAKCSESYSAGISIASIAARAGVSTSTFYRWLDEGERAQAAYEAGGDDYDEDDDSKMRRAFWDAIKKSRAQLEYDLAVEAKRCGKKALLAITFLGRRFREDWERRTMVDDARSDGKTSVIFRRVDLDPNIVGDQLSEVTLTSDSAPTSDDE
jgi:hypothetical protein